jgi:hypothetical protein
MANIAAEIEEKKRKEIAKEICVQYDQDMREREGWEKKQTEWYKLWTGDRDDLFWPDTTKKRSNVNVPLMSSAANQFHSRSYQSIFSPADLVTVMPMGFEDIKKAKSVERFLNWQLLYSIPGFEDEFDRLLQLLPINGIAYKKLYYSKEHECPISEHVSGTDIVLPYNTKTLETARRIVHRIYKFKEEISEDYVDYDKVGEDGDPSLVKEVANKKEGLDPDEHPLLLLECHKDYDIGKGRKPYLFLVDYKSQTLLKVTSRVHNGKTLNHFVDYQFILNPEGFLGFGLGHFLQDLNEMANTTFNQIFDCGSLTNMPFGFHEGATSYNSTIKTSPGAMNRVKNAKSIYFPTMQRVDQVLFMVLGQIQAYIEQFTSTSDYMMGRESKGTKTPTARGTQAIIEQGLVTFTVMAKRIFRSFQKELKIIKSLNELFMPDKKEYRVMGKDIAFEDFKKADWGSVADIIPVGDPSYASRGARRAEAMELYQVLMTNPLIVGNPELQMQPNQKAIFAITKHVVDTYNVVNREDLLPDVVDPPKEPTVENAMFAQGDRPEPVLGEDHQKHLTVHASVKETTWYKSWKAEDKKALQEHENQTIAIMQQEIAMKQQTGGMDGTDGEIEGGSSSPTASNQGADGGGVQGMAAATDDQAIPGTSEPNEAGIID